MLPTDPLTGPLFGTTKEDGLVFFPYAIRAVPVPVSEKQVGHLRTATLVTVIILTALLVSGLAFAAALTLMIVTSGFSPVIFGFNLYWLLVVQASLIVLTATLYDLKIRRILRTP